MPLASKTILLLATFTLVQSLSSANAELVLFDNGVANIDRPLFSDSSNGQILADDFRLPGDARLTAISWSGVYGRIDPLATDLFQIRILRDADPSDGVRFLTLHSISTSDVNRVDSGMDFGSLDIFNYEADISGLNIELDDDETYWLSIFNETSVNTGDLAGWAWSLEDGVGTAASMNPTRPWQTFSGSADFQISGQFTSVPEPSSFIATTLGATILMRRRRLAALR